MLGNNIKSIKETAKYLYNNLQVKENVKLKKLYEKFISYMKRTQKLTAWGHFIWCKI